MGRRARDRLLAAGRAAPGEPQPQRHHRHLPRAGAASNRALSSHSRRARRRDRRLRRATAGRASARCSRGCTSPRRAQARRLAKEHAGDLRDLRPAVARRPLADGAPLRRAPRAAGGAASSTGERWQTPEHVRRPAASSAAARPAARRASRACVAKRLDSTYEPGRRTRRLDQDQELRAPGVRRSAAGCRARATPHGARSARCCVGVHERRTARCATPAASAAASATRSSTRLAAPLARSSARTRRSRRRQPAAARCRSSASRGWWPRSSSPSGPGTGCLRHPSYKGLREDKPAEEVVREDRPTRSPCATPRHAPSRDAPGDAAPGDAAPSRAARGRGARGRGARGRVAPNRATSSRDGFSVPQTAVKTARVRVEGRELTLSNLDKVLYPAGGLHQARGDRLLRGDRAGAAAAPRRAPADGHALARRRAGQVVLPEAVAGAPPRLGADGDGSSERRASRSTTPLVERPADARLAREPRRARAPRAARARATAIDRPTALVFDLDPGAPATIIECCRVALWLHGTFEQLGLAELRQDVRVQGAAGLRAARPRSASPTSRRSRSRKAVAELRRAGRARARRLAHDQVAAAPARC